MENVDQPHLPERSWGGEIPLVLLPPVALAPRVRMQRSLVPLRSTSLEINSGFKETFSTVRKKTALEEGKFIPCPFILLVQDHTT